MNSVKYTLQDMGRYECHIGGLSADEMPYGRVVGELSKDIDCLIFSGGVNS